MKTPLIFLILILTPLFGETLVTQELLIPNRIQIAMEDSNEALYELTLIATIHSPVVDGEILQACSIEIDKDKAIIAYNMQGEIYKGGVDIFSVKDLDSTSLLARTLFTDSKINYANLASNTLFLAMTCDDQTLPCQAAISTIDTKEKDPSQFLSLTSFAATHMHFPSSKEIYALSSSTGGLHALTTNPLLAQIAFLPLDDARWIRKQSKKADELYVLQGTPGRLAVISTANNTLTLTKTFPISGLDDPEAKSTFELEGDIAFIAAGQEGVKVISTQSGKLLCSVPVPEISGVDPEDQTTTALTTNGSLLCVADAGAGISLYEGEKNFSQLNSEDDLKLVPAGRFIIGGNSSANHLAISKNYLLVASGKQGVKIIEMTKKKTSEKRSPKKR